MGKANSLAGFVLLARPPEKIENALMVFRVDPAAIVADFEDRKAELGAAPNRDVTGDAGLEVFQGVVDQVGENLLRSRGGRW